MYNEVDGIIEEKGGNESMESMYWRVVIRYGHVGRMKEISVPRFIRTTESTTICEVYKIAAEMPGVKNRGVILIEKIDCDRYESGKLSEKENPYDYVSCRISYDF